MIKYLPSLFTCLNLLCGFVAILVGDYTRMGDQLLYSLEDGVPSQGLVNRSNSRKDLFKYGIYGRRYP